MDSNPFLVDTLIGAGVFIMFVIFLAICVFIAGSLWGGGGDDDY